MANEITDEQLLLFEQRFGVRYERGEVNGFAFAFAVTHRLEGPGGYHWGHVDAHGAGPIVNWYVRDARGHLLAHGAEFASSRYENLKRAVRWVTMYGAKRVKLRGREHST